MSVLNVIQEVAKENHVRPSQPLTSAVIASQIAITASPISAATAAMYVVVEKMGVSFGQALAVIDPSAVFGAIVTAIPVCRGSIWTKTPSSKRDSKKV